MADGGDAGRAVRYPFDYDRLAKGDVIAAPRLAEILGAAPGTVEYTKKLFFLKQRVEHELWARGKEYTLAVKGMDLHILIDADASVYNEVWFDRHARGMKRSHQRHVAVDIGALDPDVRGRHERAVRVQGMLLAALTVARREAAVIPAARPGAMLPQPQ